MKICKVGNQTNSQDPQAVNSRIFVGNLNTFQCSKMDVERMFQRYGRLADNENLTVGEETIFSHATSVEMIDNFLNTNTENARMRRSRVLMTTFQLRQTAKLTSISENLKMVNDYRQVVRRQCGNERFLSHCRMKCIPGGELLQNAPSVALSIYE